MSARKGKFMPAEHLRQIVWDKAHIRVPREVRRGRGGGARDVHDEDCILQPRCVASARRRRRRAQDGAGGMTDMALALEEPTLASIPQGERLRGYSRAPSPV